MNRHLISVFLLSMAVTVTVSACQSGAEAFIDNRLLSVCDEAYQICGFPAGCVLDRDHYIEGVFPGSRRFVVVTESRDVKITVRLYFETQVAPGTQLLIHAYEPDCTVNKSKAETILENVDIFKKAGSDRMLEFEMETADEGEHLVELSSDAAAEYLLVVLQSY